MSNKDKVIYGIDLGTTYSCLAYVDADGKASVIKDKRTGGATVPSSVLKEGDDTVVGRTAKNQSMSKADKYADLFKRHIGEADEKDPKKPYQYTLDGKNYSPQALSAAVLTKLVNNANEVLRGHQLISSDNMRAVITYPAYFNDSQRNATEEAAKIAGLDLVDIIEEPLAAANYYVNTSNVAAPRNILVYDLGGGTFDITLVKYLENGKLEKLCVDGNARLGGADWDKKLIDFFVRQISEENGVSQEELRQDIKFMQDLSNKAEALKIELTETEEGSITVMSRHIKNDMMSQDISISRNKFEELTKSLLESTVSLIDHMYSEHAALNLPQPDEILFVGGSTKMPQVTTRLREKYPRLPILSPDPDEAVAKGAAIYAQKLLETATEKPRIAGETGGGTKYQLGEGGIIQKASRSYGVKCYNGSGKLVINNVIIAHKTLTSELAIETYATSADFQKTAEVKIYESTASEEYIDLDDPRAALIVEGELPLSGNELKGSPITVQFDMSFGNMLKVKGEDKKTGKTVHLECALKGSISDEEIKRERENLAKGFQNK